MTYGSFRCTWPLCWKIWKKIFYQYISLVCFQRFEHQVDQMATINLWILSKQMRDKICPRTNPPPPPLLNKCHIDNDVTLTLVIDFRSEARHTLSYVTDNLCSKYEHLIFLLIKVIDQTWKSDKLTDRCMDRLKGTEREMILLYPFWTIIVTLVSVTILAI